MKNAVTELE